MGIPVDYSVSMTPDGKKFVFSVNKTQSDIWMIENMEYGHCLFRPATGSVLSIPSILSSLARVITEFQNLYGGRIFYLKRRGVSYQQVKCRAATQLLAFPWTSLKSSTAFFVGMTWTSSP